MGVGALALQWMLAQETAHGDPTGSEVKAT